VSAVVEAPAPPARPPSRLRGWAWAGAGATAVAGVLHVLAAVDHLEAGDLVVGFFLVTAFGQLATAAGLAIAAVTGRRPAAGPLAGLLAVTVGLLALYLVAHTTDLLVGVTAAELGAAGHEHPEPTGPVALGDAPPVRGEPAGLLGTATATAEVLSVLAFVALLPPRVRRPAGNALAVLGAAAWLLWLTGVLG
jgi:hypothetical protein